MKPLRLVLPLVLLIGSVRPAHGDEIFTGLFAHDVNTPFSIGGFESGADLQLGWRGNRIRALSFIGAPSPHVFGSLSTSGDTNFVVAGVSWRIGGRLYLRPGIGLAVHDRDALIVGEDGLRRDLGSRILFAPEIGAGYRISEQASIEASWVHLSQGQLFTRQNPGMDSLGIRLNYRFR
jgi:hypothetical protein